MKRRTFFGMVSAVVGMCCGAKAKPVLAGREGITLAMVPEGWEVR